MGRMHTGPIESAKLPSVRGEECCWSRTLKKFGLPSEAPARRQHGSTAAPETSRSAACTETDFAGLGC